MTITELQARGFDQSHRDGRYIKVRCSCCIASVVNGYAIHERGCPQDLHECRGCNALIRSNVDYCSDCL